MRPPLVSVLIPTYNRAEKVGRAIDSVLLQTHRPIEIVVSDNSSTDGTEDVCRRYAADHSEVRYIRRPVNTGSTWNFQSLRAEAGGEYLLFLGDDDWLDPNYVEVCLRVFEGRSALTIVAGEGLYYEPDGDVSRDPVPINLPHARGTDRVAAYYRDVNRNTIAYGLIRTSADRLVPPFSNVMAGDWLYCAALAFLGEVASCDDVHVHREVGGLTTSHAQLASALELGHFATRFPWLAIVQSVFVDIGYRSPIYAGLGRGGRLIFAVRCARVLVVHWAADIGRHAAVHQGAFERWRKEKHGDFDRWRKEKRFLIASSPAVRRLRGRR